MFLNSGEIDFKIINRIIDNYISLYKAFPPKTKNLLKRQILMLKEIKENPIYLKDKLNFAKMLEVQQRFLTTQKK